MIVTDSNFYEVVSSHKVILVDFCAELCGPCKKLSPILDEISSENNLWVGKLNVDENTIKSKEFSVTSIPTMIVFEDGKAVKTIIGAKPKHLLVEELSKWI
jgi:thioredoxin 1